MKRRITTCLAVSLLGVAAFASGGCSDVQRATGSDNAFLTAPLQSAMISNKESDDFLPMAAGNTWQMRAISDGKRTQELLTMSKPAVASSGGGVTAEIDITRNRAPWRNESYLKDSSGLYLTSMKDETSPKMVFDPPIPILKYGFQEGQYWRWTGTVRFNNQDAPASGYTRLSALESVDTAAGKFKTCRVDTIMTLTTHGQDYRFPMVRWFAPHVGLVRRGFAEKGLPAFAELTTFNVH